MAEGKRVDGLADEEQAVQTRVYRGDKGKFYHENVARDMIDLHNARLIDNAPAVWDSLSGRYLMGFDAWDRCVMNMVDGTTMRQRKEVAEFLRLQAPRRRQGDVHLIACANGVINPWAEGYDETNDDGSPVGLIENTPEMNIPNVIPTAFNPLAYDEATDRALDDFSCGDMAVRTNLEEILAACIYRGTEVQCMPVLVGHGGNGKSTFMQMLSGLVGEDNVSAVSLDDLGKRFMQAPLVGKLANVGDDIADGFIESGPLAVIRKIVTGEPVSCEEKYRQPVRATIYATQVFSANVFPKLADSTTGMIDRIHGVRFAADFRHNPERRVAGMARTLDSDASRQYLLNLALRRLPALVKRGAYTSTTYSESMHSSIELDNDTVAYWIDADAIELQDINGRPVSEVYNDYQSSCRDAGGKPVSQRVFSMRVNRIMGTVTEKCVNIGGRQVRGFMLANTRSGT